VLEDEQAEKRDAKSDEEEEEEEEISFEVDSEDVPDEVTEDFDDSLNYESMTVVQLKGLLKEAGKPVSGKKSELIERLKE